MPMFVRLAFSPIVLLTALLVMTIVMVIAIISVIISGITLAALFTAAWVLDLEVWLWQYQVKTSSASSTRCSTPRCASAWPCTSAGSREVA